MRDAMRIWLVVGGGDGDVTFLLFHFGGCCCCEWLGIKWFEKKIKRDVLHACTHACIASEVGDVFSSKVSIFRFVHGWLCRWSEGR